ncbi:MAG: ACP S-malonyltransferase [Legionella sp.]|nr:ACP S-malonyltransferase [Legionella sp.]
MIITMFPGQGSQVQGMGKELFQAYPLETAFASDLLGYDVVSLCLNDKEQRLNATQYTQPLIYLVSALAFLEAKQNPDAVIGHSLGLYTALFATGVFTFVQGLAIVKERARLMAQAQNGSMLAVIGEHCDRLADLLITEGFNDVDIANDNTYTQRVLSGKKDRLAALAPLLHKAHFRIVPLAVSGAFHSRYMKDVAHSFFKFLSQYDFAEPKIPVISSTHGGFISSSHLLEELTYQLVQPVRWRQTIVSLINKYPQAHFQEIGPGHVLSQLNQQIMAYKKELG